MTLKGALLAILMLILPSLAAAELKLPNTVAANGEACVEPTDFMRRYHMDLLMHQRDVTVIDGIRTKKHSLVGCIDCHAHKDTSGEYIPVNAKDQFCESCHTFSAVQMDCFSCHRATPDVSVAND